MEMDVIGSLFDSANPSQTQEIVNSSMLSEAISPDDVTGLLLRSFNEAEDDGDKEETNDEDIDWGISDSDVDDEPKEDTEPSEEPEDIESEDDSDTDEDTSSDDDSAEEDTENEQPDESEEPSEEGEILGSYEAIKDELDSERETLSEIYERFFKDVVDPLFRRLEDSNINVAFDTTKLKSEGLIRIELSHRNSDAKAEMEINIFANTVNGEFLGMENSEGEAVSTSLDDVSLDDLLNILIKVLD